MYDQQVNILKQIVEKLANKARFKKTPTLKISKDKQPLAKASILRKKITVGAELLSQWQKGELDETDVEVILAHEIGHLIDFDRKFHSVFFRCTAIVFSYLVLGVVLLKLGSHLPVAEPWVLFGMLFTIWAIPFHWILRKAACAAQLEADKNGARLTTEEEFANSVVRRTHFSGTKAFGLIETWDLLLYVILFPSLNERLRNLNFEIKESKIEIQRIKDGQST